MESTSLLAHEEIQPRLPEKYAAILSRMSAGPEPMTAQEISAYVRGAWKRMKEMQDKGLVVRFGIRKCSITGHPAWTWVRA
jgi:hypothetical protein